MLSATADATQGGGELTVAYRARVRKSEEQRDRIDPGPALLFAFGEGILRGEECVEAVA